MGDVQWWRVTGAHLSRVEEHHDGVLVCITFEPFSESTKPFGFMANERTIREMGVGLSNLAEQMKQGREEKASKAKTKRRKS